MLRDDSAKPCAPRALCLSNLACHYAKAEFCIRGLASIPFSAPLNLSKELPVFRFEPQNRFYAREHRIDAPFAGILGRHRIPSSRALNSMPSACDRSLLSLKFKEKCMNPRTQPAQALCPTPSQYRRLAEVRCSYGRHVLTFFLS